MSDESKTCFMTVANRQYQKYIPWFLYFLNRAYPEAHKLILLDGIITDNIRRMLTLLSGNFEIRERAFPEYTHTNGNTIKCLRWLVYESAFEQYDCMSIGDVDIAIYAETPSYMEQHIVHCNQLEIPYSNFIRSPQARYRRMSGIHVVKPKEWFTVMKPLIDKYRSMLETGLINPHGQGFNEQLLLRMIIESDLGEPPSNLSETYSQSIITSNHHGTHIRLVEHNGIKGLQNIRGYRTYRSEILAAVQTVLFSQLLAMSPQIGYMLQSIAKVYKNF